MLFLKTFLINSTGIREDAIKIEINLLKTEINARLLLNQLTSYDYLQKFLKRLVMVMR